MLPPFPPDGGMVSWRTAKRVGRGMLSLGMARTAWWQGLSSPLPPPPPLPARGDYVQKVENLIFDRQQKRGNGDRSYVQAAQQGSGAAVLARGDDEGSGWHTVRNRRELHQPPVTNMAGRCYRCLGRGHFARDCRDPIVCRVCLRTGHRKKECTNQGGMHRHEVDRRPAVMEGMETCLVGEVREGAPTAATILQGIPSSDKNSGQLECFQLDSGGFLLRGLSEEMYRELWGANQNNAEGDKIRWRRPLATDGVQMVKQEIATLEVRGVPFGLRSWTHTASLVRRFGSLRSMLNNGFQQGDPNVMCIEVAVSPGSKVPLSVAYDPAQGGKMAYISEIPGSSLTPGQTAGSATPIHVPPPKASTGKVMTRSLGLISWRIARRRQGESGRVTTTAQWRRSPEYNETGAPPALQATHLASLSPKKMKALQRAPALLNPTGLPWWAEHGRWHACKAE